MENNANLSAPAERDVLLEVRNVTMKFTKYEVGVDSLKELVVRALKGDLKREKFICLENISSADFLEPALLIGRRGTDQSAFIVQIPNQYIAGLLGRSFRAAPIDGR